MENNSNITKSPTEDFEYVNFPNITEDEMEKLRRLYAGYIFYLLSIYIIIITPAIFGNTLILVSLFRFRRLRSRINILIGNLAVSDLLLGLVVIPFDIAFLHVKALQEEKIPCLVRQSLIVILLDASILNLTIYCDCFIRSNMLNFAENGDSLFIFGISWSISIIIGAIPLMGWNTWEQGKFCDNELVWCEEYRGLQYLTICSCLIANFIMYVKVMRTAWRRLKETKRISGTSDTNSQRHINISKKDVRKTKIMVLVLGIFAICWGPYCVIIITETFFVDKNIELIIAKKFFGCLGMMNSGLNWIVYGVKNKNFRQAFKYLLSFGACGNKDGYDMSTTK
ncbi:hypothetical protein KUTeg_004569 [Tegillarca granosa]|uniref:G-protein coupled receptors family 1 profile domain-containing protein n=1 Tax=Tegillarca granosa TaxID=220873 RepID=A0ABQ9FQF1_TEGGR|nr:hypothetical protein KUTeg_004569 [Tegillarca granosa]